MNARASKKRILLIDDSEAIHQDFRRMLNPEQRADRKALALMEETLFGEAPSEESLPALDLEMDSAMQGQEGFEKVRQAQESGQPYELIFLDYRMPPGWNGIETLRHLRKVAPTLPVVLCSAYSDYSWEKILEEFPDRRLLAELRKPVTRDQVREVLSTFTG
jgi:CheY-like chemotaxis protein